MDPTQNHGSDTCHCSEPVTPGSVKTSATDWHPGSRDYIIAREAPTSMLNYLIKSENVGCLFVSTPNNCSDAGSIKLHQHPILQCKYQQEIFIRICFVQLYKQPVYHLSIFS